MGLKKSCIITQSSKRALIHPSSCHVALLNKGFLVLWNQCYPCDVCGTSLDVQDLLSRQMVPARSGNSRSQHPTNRNAAFFQRWRVSTFCFGKSLRSASWQAGILLQRARSCFNAFRLFPQISGATAEVRWGWFCLILLAMCEQSLFWQACWMCLHSSQ